MSYILDFEFNFAKISSQRQLLMGIAAIMIVIGHAANYGVYIPYNLSSLIERGGMGVDLFLFLSGVGLYYSLSNNTNTKRWYKKRFFRIFIPYFLMQLPFWTYYIIIGDFCFTESLLVFSTISFWTKHVGAWYVALLVPLYLLAPLVFILLKDNDKTKWFVAIIIIALIIGLCNIEIDNNECTTNQVLRNMQWAFGRSVNFIVGMATAPLVIRNYKIKGWILIVCSFVLYICGRQIIANDLLSMWWTLVPLLIVLFSWMLDAISKIKCVVLFISWMGAVSLESYLANIYMCKLTKDVMLRFFNGGGIFNGHYLEYIVIIALGLFLSAIVHSMSEKLKKCISI